MPGMQEIPNLYYNGRALDTDPSSFGLLKSSAGQIDALDVLRARMVEDGYIYLPGLLDRDDVVHPTVPGKYIDFRLAGAGPVSESTVGSKAKPGRFFIVLGEG